MRHPAVSVLLLVAISALTGLTEAASYSSVRSAVSGLSKSGIPLSYISQLIRKERFSYLSNGSYAHTLFLPTDAAFVAGLERFNLPEGWAATHLGLADDLVNYMTSETVISKFTNGQKVPTLKVYEGKNKDVPFPLKVVVSGLESRPVYKIKCTGIVGVNHAGCASGSATLVTTAVKAGKSKIFITDRLLVPPGWPYGAFNPTSSTPTNSPPEPSTTSPSPPSDGESSAPPPPFSSIVTFLASVNATIFASSVAVLPQSVYFGGQPITIFAQSDQVFAFLQAQPLNGVPLSVYTDPVQLAELFSYHIIPNASLKLADLANGQVLMSVSNRTLTVQKPGVNGSALSIVGERNSANPHGDYTYGLITLHLLDNLLLPPGWPRVSSPSPAPVTVSASPPPHPPAPVTVSVSPPHSPPTPLAAQPPFSSVAAFLASLNATIFATSVALLPQAVYFGGQPLTIFAPSDRVFAYLQSQPLNGIPFSVYADRAALAELFSYHIVPNASLTLADLTNGQVLKTVSNQTLTVQKPGVNGSALSIVGERNSANPQGDYTYGVITLHLLDNLLLPPGWPHLSPPTLPPAIVTANPPPAVATYTSIAAALADPSLQLSLLTQALVASGLVNSFPNLPGAATVFAPNDAAFTSAIQQLNIPVEKLLANKDLLSLIIFQHIYVGQALTADKLSAGLNLQMLSGGKITTSAASNGLIKLAGPLNSANIVRNVRITGGAGAPEAYLHIIDTVLLPLGYQELLPK